MGRAGVRRCGVEHWRRSRARRPAGLGKTASGAVQGSEGAAPRDRAAAQRHGQGCETGCSQVVRMNPAVASLLALILAIVLSIVSRINVGLVAVGLAWLIGVYVAGLAP